MVTEFFNVLSYFKPQPSPFVFKIEYVCSKTFLDHDVWAFLVRNNANRVEIQ